MKKKEQEITAAQRIVTLFDTIRTFSPKTYVETKTNVWCPFEVIYVPNQASILLRIYKKNAHGIITTYHLTVVDRGKLMVRSLRIKATYRDIQALKPYTQSVKTHYNVAEIDLNCIGLPVKDTPLARSVMTAKFRLRHLQMITHICDYLISKLPRPYNEPMIYPQGYGNCYCHCNVGDPDVYFTLNERRVHDHIGVSFSETDKHLKLHPTAHCPFNSVFYDIVNTKLKLGLKPSEFHLLKEYTPCNAFTLRNEILAIRANAYAGIYNQSRCDYELLSEYDYYRAVYLMIVDADPEQQLSADPWAIYIRGKNLDRKAKSRLKNARLYDIFGSNSALDLP